MKTIRLAALAATLACAGNSLFAASVSSANSSVTGLTYQLIDLDPADGIAPSLYIDPTWASLTLTTTQGEDSTQRWVLGDAFSSTNGALSSAQGALSAAKNGNSLSSSLNLNAANIADMAYFGELGAPNGNLYQLGDTGAQAGNVYPLTWKLSAHTKLVITGTVTLDSSTDVSSLANSILVSGINNQAWTEAVETTSAFSVVLEHPDYSDIFKLAAISGQSIDQTGIHYFRNPATKSDTQSFQINYENNTSGEVAGSLAINVGVVTRVYAQALGVTAPVPEPGTWALMAMGLGLMGWRARSQRS